MATIIETILRVGDFAHGGAPEATAREWALAGFDAEDTAAWLEARCFDARAAAQLRDLNVAPDEASTAVDVAGYRDTLGYAVASGDLDLVRACRLINKVPGG